VRVRDPKFSRFDTIPACDGQTRRQYKPRILERVQRTQEADSYVTLKATQGHRKERDEVHQLLSLVRTDNVAGLHYLQYTRAHPLYSVGDCL